MEEFMAMKCNETLQLLFAHKIHCCVVVESQVTMKLMENDVYFCFLMLEDVRYDSTGPLFFFFDVANSAQLGDGNGS